MSQYLSEGEIASLGLGSVGANCLIHRTANLVFPENMSIGDNFRLDAFTNIVASTSIRFGRNIHIASYVFMSASANILLGDFSAVSQGSKIYTASDDYSGGAMTNPTVPAEFKAVDSAPVSIGRHAIVGAGSIIMPGVTIGEGVAVGALSLVKSSLEPWGVYAGVPAVFVKARSRNLLDLERRYLEQEAARDD